MAKKLRRAIELTGLSGAEVARRALVPQPRISQWCDEESKRRPTLEQAGRVARVLGVPLDWLADPTTCEDPPPPVVTEAERIVLAAYRKTGLPPDEAVRWLWLGKDAVGRPPIEVTPSHPSREKPRSKRRSTAG